MTFIAIYSSFQLADCEHRAFVLRAVGVEHVVEQRGDVFSLLVPQDIAGIASEHLRRYEEESRPLPAPPPLKLYGNAWSGSIGYALLLLIIAYCAGAGMGHPDWFSRGALNAAAVREDQWWRLVTALTLHADAGHLIGNLAFGVPYGFFASQLLGTGRAWASILLAAVLGNALDSVLMSGQHETIGASTAVFAMLGIVGAYTWRTGFTGVTRWAYRWAPMVAAVAVLALTGAGGERTDVVAHLAGFLAGAVMGTLQAHVPDRLRTPVLQWSAGIASVATVIGAWCWALMTL